MSYVRFTEIENVIKTFGLKYQSQSLFTDVEPVDPSDFLRLSIEKAAKVGFKTDKEIAERYLSPILLEVVERFGENIVLYSGHDLDVDIPKGLKGEIDFMFDYGQHSSYVNNPIFSAVAHRWQTDGLSQSIAQLVGIQTFNKEKRRNAIKLKEYFGCTTDGRTWCFLKLIDNQIFTADRERHYPLDLPKVLGIFKNIFENYKNQIKYDSAE